VDFTRLASAGQHVFYLNISALKRTPLKPIGVQNPLNGKKRQNTKPGPNQFVQIYCFNFACFIGKNLGFETSGETCLPKRLEI